MNVKMTICGRMCTSKSAHAIIDSITHKIFTIIPCLQKKKKKEKKKIKKVRLPAEKYMQIPFKMYETLGGNYII